MRRPFELDDAGAVLESGGEGVVGLDLLGLDAHVNERAALDAAYLESDRLARLVAERADRLEWRAIGGDDLVAEQKPRLVGGQAGEHGADEGLAVDHLGEHADARIGDGFVGEELRDIAAQPVGEYVDELVIGGLIARVVVRVRDAELGQHGVDRGGAFRLRLGIFVVGAVPIADRLPVKALQVAVVELVAHDPPRFVEDLRVLLAGACLSGETRGSEREKCEGESEKSGAEQRTKDRASTHAASSCEAVFENVGTKIGRARMAARVYRDGAGFSSP